MILSKQAVTTLALALLSSGFTASANLLRGDETTCGAYKDAASCDLASIDGGKEPCVWCQCSAVPSVCVTRTQSAGLPQGVFECAEPKQQQQQQTKLELNFVSGVTHSIQDDDVDKDFCDPTSPRSLSGYMDITGSKFDSNDEDKHLFYWFFEKRSTAVATDKTIPFILWLTGGPGCSSSLALLTENGPCKVKDTGDATEVNPHAWTESAHMLWLDQPAGVGYSYGKATDRNEEMVGEDAYYFLQAFFKAHPEYSENPLFIVGESYGGHYAPAIAHRILVGNTAEAAETEVLNLKGLAVGNGLTDPEIQYQYYPEMAYKNSHGIKTISEATYNAMKRAAPTCTKLIKSCDSALTKIGTTFKCQMAFAYCNMALTMPFQMTGLNVYDIRKKCTIKPLCYDFSHITKFLNLDSTKKALHISDKSSKWETCNMAINKSFMSDWMGDFAPQVKDLLEAGIPALIYAGDVDFICNYLGNKAWTTGLDWQHKDDFNKAEDHEWSEKKGLARTSNLLTFLQVYDAGHMVPSDQPEVALEMITQFVTGKVPF